MLRQMLFADLERQLRLEGRTNPVPTLAKLVLRILHPRFLPLALYRFSRSAFIAGLSPLAHLFSYANLVLFGLEIAPRCDIGPGLFLPHTYGTVIGATQIGSCVTIFQGVTLGARGLDMSFDPQLRPKVGNHVTIGAGAKVLGDVALGDNVKVGANSVVLHSVPGGCTVTGVPAKVTGSHPEEE